MKKKFLSVMLASVMAMSMIGCGSSAVSGVAETETTESADSTQSADTAQSSDATAAEATGEGSGEDLNVMLETPVESLDPQQATDGTSFEVIADYTDGLMQMDADGQAVNAIAESYDISEDGLTYTFHLRADANWSNGEPVTANDFVFAWQRAVDPEIASEYSYMLSDIGQIVNAQEIIDGTKDKSELGVTAVDDKTLEVKLNVPVSYFLSLMYFPTFYPVNQAFYESVGDTFATSPETTLSNGAFVLDDYQPAATAIHLTKNADYYNADSVKLAGLNYQVIQDSQQALMSYQNGDLDTTLVNGEQVDQVKDDPAFTAIGAGYLWYISPNIKEVKELDNLNIRLALTMALNREAITTDVLKDGSAPTFTAVPMDFAAGPDGSDFSEDQTRFQDVCRYDAAAAADYWAKGLEELGITELNLTMIHDADDAPIKVAQVVKEQLETTLPGLTVDLQQMPKKERVERMQEGEFEIALTRWGPDYADPMTYLGMWITNNSNNYGFWSNAEYDQLIKDCTTGAYITDYDARWDAMYKAETLVLQEAVIAPLYTKANANLITAGVENIQFHPVALNRVYKDVTIK